jgi:hypothetical protein
MDGNIFITLSKLSLQQVYKIKNSKKHRSLKEIPKILVINLNVTSKHVK